MPNRDLYRRAGWALAVIGAALAVAGCGFTGGSSEAESSGGPESPTAAANFLKFSTCMRSHGVPNFPDPGSSGIEISPGSGVNPASPAFQSAQRDCKKLLPGGGPKAGPAPPPSASAIRAALTWAQCVRKHGVPNFPDPSTSGGGEGLFFRGVVFPVGPSFNPESPAFKQAQAVCGFGPSAQGG
ncbi:MAG TPA: hypothetical protein VMJ65_07725 [Solirubrobacteraceae bacterium]|nr:hypothetical protein [Solirubrobacteraceae bacterium]